jgi:hypothetical protein
VELELQIEGITRGVVQVVSESNYSNNEITKKLLYTDTFEMQTFKLYELFITYVDGIQTVSTTLHEKHIVTL